METPKEIIDELAELSPRLLECKQAARRPEVPAGYFEQFADTVWTQISEPDISVLPGLDRSRKPMVPESYFDSLADEVMNKVREQEQAIGQGEPIGEKAGIRMLYFRRLAVAATLLGIIALGALLFERQTMPVNECEDGIACLTREEIRQYVSEHADEFEADAIHEAFQPEIDAEALTIPVAENEVATAPVMNEEQIEKYIQENPAVIDMEEPSMDIF